MQAINSDDWLAGGEEKLHTGLDRVYMEQVFPSVTNARSAFIFIYWLWLQGQGEEGERAASNKDKKHRVIAGVYYTRPRPRAHTHPTRTPRTHRLQAHSHIAITHSTNPYLAMRVEKMQEDGEA